MTEIDHSEIMRAIGRLEGKVDGMNDSIASFKVDIKEMRGIVDSHQSFIDNWKGRIIAVSVLAGFGSTFLIQWIKNKVGLN